MGFGWLWSFCFLEALDLLPKKITSMGVKCHMQMKLVLGDSLIVSLGLPIDFSCVNYVALHLYIHVYAYRYLYVLHVH